MRTNVDLDEKLVERALDLSGCRTKRELLHRCLTEFVRKREQRRILELAGKVLWDGDLRELRGDAR